MFECPYCGSTNTSFFEDNLIYDNIDDTTKNLDVEISVMYCKDCNQVSDNESSITAEVCEDKVASN